MLRRSLLKSLRFALFALSSSSAFYRKVRLSDSQSLGQRSAVAKCPQRGVEDGSVSVAIVLSGLEGGIATALEGVEVGLCRLGHSYKERQTSPVCRASCAGLSTFKVEGPALAAFLTDVAGQTLGCAGDVRSRSHV